MKMTDVMMKKIGLYICMVMDAAFVLLAWYLSRFVNGIPPEIFTFIGIVIAGGSALAKYIIQYYFKLEVEEFQLRNN